MKTEKKILVVIMVILLIPAFLFFFKPEINTQNDFIKFSWRESAGEVKHAIEKKSPAELTKKVYGNLGNLFKNKVLNEKMDNKYNSFLYDSRNKAKNFIRKCKTFISLIRFF